MALISTYSLAELQPAYAKHLATTRGIQLPYGGPTGTGGKFARGTILGCVGGTAQSEVVTLTVDGTVAHTTTFTGDKVYQVSHAYNATVASVLTLWEAVFGPGNVLVGGTAGTTYTLTLRSQLANVRLGGLFAASAGVGAPTWARTTRGSSGAGQFDAYLEAGTFDRPTTARCALGLDYNSTPRGGLVNEGIPTGQAYTPYAYFGAFLNVSDLTGLDAAAMSDPGFRLVEGSAITETGAVIAIGL